MSEKQRGLRVLAVVVLIVVGVGILTFFGGKAYGKSHAQVVSEPRNAATVSPGEEGSEQTEPMSAPDVFVNDLVSPVLHHADSHAPEEGYGSFDVGVNEGQIGLAFGWHIRWLEGEMDAGGDGCDLVILTPGWYENLEMLDGRYEVYDVPSSDYSGWVGVLGQQRADEQEVHYGCPEKSFADLPQWESSIPSPP